MNEVSWNALRRQVYERAHGCCEYCQTCEANSGQTLHVDHIHPDDGDVEENLCLACWNCNTSKHQATTAIDPETGESVLLFNPRKDHWPAHFQWLEGGIWIRGLTPVGRATVDRLKMNRPAIVVARKRWVDGGYHPPDHEE
ncbi:MAG: HNH endonuclease [Anaerolineae bacterium]|nr:HNH endonuclease [Anaerolineae bacterium]